MIFLYYTMNVSITSVIGVWLPSLLFAQLPTSYVEEFLSSKPTVLRTESVTLDSSAHSITRDHFFITTASETIRVRSRMPLQHSALYPVALLVVGIETGRNVIEMISGYDDVIVVGVDYPYESALDFSGLNTITTSFALRATAFKTIPHLLLCLDWISSLPLADTNNITIVAVSFGVFTAVPAAVIDKRVDNLVVVQAGGDLYEILKANAERLDFFFPDWFSAWAGDILFAPFEPNRYIGSFAPRPLLIVSGEADSFFPPSSVWSLYNHAQQPKEWIQHTSGHVAPNERELILELTQIVGEKLYGKKK